MAKAKKQPKAQVETKAPIDDLIVISNPESIDIDSKAGEKKAIISAKMVNPFIGQMVRLSVILQGGIKPVRIVWEKNGSAMHENEHSRYIKVLPTSSARYRCTVHDQDGTEYETEMASIRAGVPIPKKCVKDHDVKFNRARLAGVTSAHWKVVEDMDAILASTDADSSLTQSMYAAITDEANPKPHLFTMYAALLSCGRLLVQDSKDGYYTLYSQRHNKTMPSKMGRMRNYWK